MAYTPRDPYTDRRRTRVYRSDNTPNEPAQDPIGQTQAIPKQTGLFEGISIAQIIAGAAAAATSVALASRIGIAGSVIGAAVSSVVTVLSSQLYRRFLQKSAEKIKTAATIASPSRNADPLGAPYDGHVAEVTEQLGKPRGARIAPTKLRARAAAQRAATQRKVVLFSVLAAAIAVALTTGIILAVTAGEGLGTKAAPFAPSTQQTQPVDQPRAGGDTDEPLDEDGADDKQSSTPSTPPATDNAGGEGDPNTPASPSSPEDTGTASPDPDTPEDPVEPQTPHGEGDGNADVSGDVNGATSGNAAR